MNKPYIILSLFLAALLSDWNLSAAEPGFSKTAAPKKARVLIVHDDKATDAFTPVPERIPALMEKGLLHFTGQSNVTTAWNSLIAPDDVVGIKVYSAPGAQSGTRPAVVAAVVQGLLAAGVPAKNIIIWDKHLADLRLAGFSDLSHRFKVSLAGAVHAGFDEKVFYENAIRGEPIWGDLEFGSKAEGIGRKSYVSKLLTRQLTKIINVTPMLNHNHAGVTGNVYGLALGSIDNGSRFENNAARLAVAVPEIYNLPELADRVVLNIVDALVCQYQGEQRSLVHYSTALNQLRFSKDPVALDVLSLLELERQRALSKHSSASPNFELYGNASLLQLGESDPAKIVVETVK